MKAVRHLEHRTRTLMGAPWKTTGGGPDRVSVILDFGSSSRQRPQTARPPATAWPHTVHSPARRRITGRAARNEAVSGMSPRLSSVRATQPATSQSAVWSRTRRSTRLAIQTARSWSSACSGSPRRYSVSASRKPEAATHVAGLARRFELVGQRVDLRRRRRPPGLGHERPGRGRSGEARISVRFDPGGDPSECRDDMRFQQLDGSPRGFGAIGEDVEKFGDDLHQSAEHPTAQARSRRSSTARSSPRPGALPR